MVEDPADLLFRQALAEIPDMSEHFEQVHLAPGVMHLFMDGSCALPTQPCSRLATWGVVVADLVEQTFPPVA